MDENFGPWISYDGTGMPVGSELIVFVEFDGGETTWPNPAKAGQWDWSWTIGDEMNIARYRIRKPRGLMVLQDLIENLPVDRPETVSA